MSIAYLLCEALKDISSENKLYHRTNIDAFVQIIKSNGLMGYNYGNRMAIDKDNKEEVATGRKSTFTTIDKTKKYTDLSGSIGNLQIELFVDRIKASVRNNKIVPIAEYNVINKRDIERELNQLIVPRYLESIEKMANLLIKNIKEILATQEKTGGSKNQVVKIVDILDANFPNARKKIFSFNKWEELYKCLIRYNTQSKKAREGEERINLPKDKKIPLDPLLMQVRVLPSFEIDFKDYASDFIHLKQLEDLLVALKHPIVLKDASQSRMVNFIMKAIKILNEEGADKLLDYYGLDKGAKSFIHFRKKVAEEKTTASSS